MWNTEIRKHKGRTKDAFQNFSKVLRDKKCSQRQRKITKVFISYDVNLSADEEKILINKDVVLPLNADKYHGQNLCAMKKFYAKLVKGLRTNQTE